MEQIKTNVLILLFLETISTTIQANTVKIEKGVLTKDLDACIRMVLSKKNKPMLFPGDNFLNNPKELLSSYFADTVLVARKEAKTIGMITFSSSNNQNETASINLLVVDETYHRQEIGTLLMQTSLENIINLQTILGVYRYNLPAQKLYKKFMFQDETDGGLKINKDDDLLLMLEHWQKKKNRPQKTTVIYRYL